MSPRSLIAAACLTAYAVAAQAQSATILSYPYPDDAPSNAFRDYAHGNLGVLSSNYGKLTLIAAFRVLTGKPLTDKEVDYIQAAPEPWSFWSDDRDKWQQALTDLFGTKSDADAQEDEDSACRPDAFRTATHQLESLRKSYGDNADVRDWAHAQAVVFKNCMKGGKGAMPAAAGSEAPRWLKLAREYQLAAATFYGGDEALARTRFEAIAGEPDSPYAATAKYMVTRIAFQQARSTDDETRSTALAETFGMAAAVEDASHGSEKARMHTLTRRIRYTQDPEGELARIERSVSTQAWTDETVQDLKDYLYALNHDENENVDWRRPVSEIAGNGSMTDWLRTVSGAGEPKSGSTGFANALAQWRATQSNVWLVAVLMTAARLHDVPPDVLAAAVAVPDRNPAYATLQYNLLRLRDGNIRALKAAGRDARTLESALEADASTLIEKEKAHFPERSINLLHRIAADYAPDPKTYIEHAWMTSTEGTPLSDRKEKPAVSAGFPSEFAEQMNLRMSVNTLLAIWRAGAGGKAPSHIAMTQMLWVRAALLGRDDVTSALTAQFKAAKPMLADEIDAYNSADAANKPVRLAKILLRDTDLAGVFSYGGWVPYGQLAPSADDVRRLASSSAASASPAPRFQSAAEAKRVRDERDRLATMSNGVAYLGPVIVAHVKQHPFDLGNPSMLAGMIEASRDAGQTKVSHAMFRLLHRWYFFTPSAHATRYYY